MGDAAKEITILPLGDIEPEPLEWISAALTVAFGAASTISPGGQLPREAWMPTREQYDSARIILFLDALATPRGGKLLGVCDVDLGSPILTFVFGAAHVDGRGAVISLARLRPPSPIAPSVRNTKRTQPRTTIASRPVNLL